MDGGKGISHSQKTLDCEHGNGDQTMEIKSFKSVQATALASNSLNQVGKHHL